MPHGIYAYEKKEVGIMFAVNYVGVVVAAVAAFMLGWVWYSPALFGKQYMKLAGHDKKSKKEQEMMKKKMVPTMLTGFIATVVTALVLAFFVGAGAGWLEGVSVAFYAWLGFVAPIMLGMVLWDCRPFQLYVINVTYYLVSLVVMGAIIGAM